MNGLQKILAHFFTPHEKNNYRAKALHFHYLTYYLLLAIVFSFAVKFIYTKSGDVLGYATDISVDKLYQLTNTTRQQNQLSSLEYSQLLAEAAQKKAQDMFAKNYWSHYGPDGKTPWDFILASGYQYEFAGENLAKNFLFSQGVVDAWMNSESHRDNILKKDYTQVGFAVVNGILDGEETTLVVQMFGKPLSTPVAKQSNLQTIQTQAAVITQSAPRAAIPPQEKIQNHTIGGESVIVSPKSSSQLPNLIHLSLNSSLIFLGFLITALALDFYFASRLRLIRVTGKNLAHVIFIGFIIAGILLLTKGAIL